MNYLKKTINLKYLGKSKISLSKALLIFYIVIANNYTKDLYSGQLSKFLENNRTMQHIIGYLTMIIIINEHAGINDIYTVVLYSLIGYIWFISTTKLDLHWNLAILSLLIIGFMYETSMIDKELKSADDQALEEQDKKIIIKQNRKMRVVIAISIIIITFIGTYFYWNKKTLQYGGNFNVKKFILN